MNQTDRTSHSSWRAWLTGRFAVVALLLLFGALAFASSMNKSAAFDEPIHLTAGYSYWKFNDYHLHPENGNLPQRWAALPLLLRDVTFPSLQSVHWRNGYVWGSAHEFLFESGNDAQAMLLSGRFMVVLLGVVLGAVVYGWSRAMFGPVGGVLSLAAYAVSPTMLAHSRVITSDLTTALFFAASLWAVWAALRRVTVPRVLLSSVLLGGLFVSKHSAVLILPVIAALAAVQVFRKARLPVGVVRAGRAVQRRWLRLLVAGGVGMVHVIVVVAVIWTAYGWRYSAFNTPESGKVTFQNHPPAVYEQAGTLGGVMEKLTWRKLLPEAYTYGFGFVLANSSRRAYLRGEYRETGWAFFFPYALLVKTPVTLLLLVAVGALLALFARRGTGRGHEDEQPAATNSALMLQLPIWLFLGVYWATAVTSTLNIGHRHILPTYPLMFVLVGGLAWVCRTRAFTGVIMGLLVLAGIESALTYPHYLSYFNHLAGGSRGGYKHLIDSSYDWGQDLLYVKTDRAARPADEAAYLAYWGTDSPTYRRIDAHRLPGFMDNDVAPDAAVEPLTPGRYYISAHLLQGGGGAAWGPWNETYEQMYAAYRSHVGGAAAFEDDEALRQGVRKLLGLPADAGVIPYSSLRFARLCAWLRAHRKPDDRAGMSIFIYDLDAGELSAALDSPFASPSP